MIGAQASPLAISVAPTRKRMSDNFQLVRNKFFSVLSNAMRAGTLLPLVLPNICSKTVWN